MDTPQNVSGFYIPYCSESDGRTQPISTALSLEAGKSLCREHFIKRCRTAKLLLPPERRADIPTALVESLSLEWSAQQSGEYHGRPQRCASTPLEALATSVYKLQPVG